MRTDAVEDVTVLSMDDVLWLHTDTIDIDGGSHVVRDYGLLNAAVAMPPQQFGGESLHKDLPTMAAASLFHIAHNHLFVDENTRAAVLSTLAYLSLNGAGKLPDPQDLESIIRQLRTG
ncbi:MAG: Fic family protein [Nitrospira sp.]